MADYSLPENRLITEDSLGTTLDPLDTRLTAVETLGGLAPGDVSDATMADIAANALSQFQEAMRPVIYDASSEVTTDKKHATLQAAIDATPVGGTLEIRKTWTVSSSPLIDKAITVRCAAGGSITTTGNFYGLSVTASDVTVDRVRILGSGSAAAGAGRAISVVGTEAAPIRRLKIRNCRISGFNHYGVYGVSVKDFDVSGNLIQDLAYSAISFSSSENGTITTNLIRDLTMPSGFVNAYGIAVTRNSTQTITDAPRSRNIVISGNTVEHVPTWEGIDTHGGQDIVITGNHVRNCGVGIALVPSTNESGDDTYAPRNIVCTGNTVDSTKSDGTAKIGIQLVGCITTVDNVVEYATAVISGNTIRGHGTATASSQSAIFLQATQGAVVTGNRIIEPSPNGITLNHNNVGFMVCDNSIIDPWSDTVAFSSAIYVPSVHQAGIVQGNRTIRGTKTATKVNDRGLYLSSALRAPDVKIQYQGNDFTACAIPVVDSPSTQNITEQRFESRKLSFYPGVTPVTRAAITGSRSDGTALANLLTALASVGLITNSTTT